MKIGPQPKPFPHPYFFITYPSFTLHPSFFIDYRNGPAASHSNNAGR